MPEKRKFIVETYDNKIAHFTGVKKKYVIFPEEDVKEITAPDPGEEKKEENKNDSMPQYPIK